MSKMRYLFALSVFIISCFLSISVHAKNPVRIATIGGVSPHLDLYEYPYIYPIIIIFEIKIEVCH